MRCTTRFYFRTIVAPYLCQWHASGCNIKSIFKCRWLMPHAPTYGCRTNLKTARQGFWLVHYNSFVGNKLNIHFGEDKRKSIVFASKWKIKRAINLNIKLKYKDIKIMQCLQVTYLGCVLDETLSGEHMVLKTSNGNISFLTVKINF